MDQPTVAATVDRRVVVSPAQARKLLAAVRGLSDRGAHLHAFYACLYYAALRPSEAVMICETDLHLPKRGGAGSIAASAYSTRRNWTNQGTARQERGLKHRANHETRAIPIPSESVRLLRAHIKRYGTTRTGESSRPPGRHHPGLRLQRGVGRGQEEGLHRSAAPVPAGPPPL